MENWLDSQTRLLYNNVCYYEPTTDNFMREDNLEIIDSYACAGDNPEICDDSTWRVDDPYLPYIGLFHRLIHPFNDVAVANQMGEFPVRFGGTGKTGTGIPDIANMDSKVIWEVKEGTRVKDPGNGAMLMTDSQAVLEESQEAQRYVGALNSQPKTYVGGWQAGNLTNDLPLAAAFMVCADTCTLVYENGGVISLQYGGQPGVLIYTPGNETPRNPGDEPVLVGINGLSPEAFVGRFQRMLQALISPGD